MTVDDDYTRITETVEALIQSGNLVLQFFFYHQTSVISFKRIYIPLKSHHFGHPLSSFTRPFVSKNRKSNHFINQNVTLSLGRSFKPHFRPGKMGATKIQRNPVSNNKLSLQIINNTY